MIKFYILVFTGLLLLLTNCKDSPDAIKYSAGQEWKYKTRPGEENSTLKILKIEEYPETGKVIHISISKLKIKNPESPEGFAEKLSHIPISEEALNKKCLKAAK